jgi:hypothetical protein
MAADLVTIATTAALTQFVGPAFKHLGEQALEQAKQVASKAVDLLGAVGREPQPVEPKLLLPLVQAASLETDEALADKWAALLANAADPAQKVQVQPGFVGAMRELTSADALILNRLYLASGVLVNGFGNSAMQKQLVAELGLSYDEITLCIDNLLRLRLCSEAATKVSSLGGGSLFGASSIGVNSYGLAFMRACTPPMP